MPPTCAWSPSTVNPAARHASGSSAISIATTAGAQSRSAHDSAGVLVEDRQHRVGVAAGDPQDDLADAEVLVVRELARVGHGAERDDAQRRRVAARPRRTPGGDPRARPGRRAPPIGIQPSAYSATWANSFGPAAPPMSTGGPSGRVGFGHDHDGSMVTCSPWNSRDVGAPQRPHREHVLAGHRAPVGAS